MRRLILLALFTLAGCATSPPPAIQLATRGSDPALMESFFGAGLQRAISPVIRCGVRCQVVK